MLFDIDLIRKVYSLLPSKIEKARSLVNHPLTLSEKILFSHLWDELPAKPYGRGDDYVNFGPDRVAMQDATARWPFYSL
jgi:aconitate hydratase